MTIFKTIYKAFLLLVIPILISSCAFNKRFFKPAKITGKPTGIFSFTIDTIRTFVKMDTTTLTPSFIRMSDDTLDFPFTIESNLFKSKSGSQLNGWFLRPKNQVAEYTILHLHGSAGFLYNQYPNIAPLIENGFQVFMFDYSGFGFSEGKPTRNTVLLDANSALDFVKGIEGVNDTKLIIYGQSYGGYLASIIGSRRQAEIDGLVIEGAFSSHRAEAVYTTPFFGRFVKKGIKAEDEIKKYHKPLLVIHSKEDKRVPFSMGENIFRHANEPKYFFEIDKPHIAAMQYYSGMISTRIKNMLKNRKDKPI